MQSKVILKPVDDGVVVALSEEDNIGFQGFLDELLEFRLLTVFIEERVGAGVRLCREGGGHKNKHKNGEEQAAHTVGFEGKILPFICS